MITVKFFLEFGSDVERATISKWLVSPGTEVAIGDPIAEIELEKANVEFNSAFAGTVSEILVSEGNEIALGTAVMKIKPC